MAKPKYAIIKEELLKEINEGKFTEGDSFYSESDLKKIYDVSSITVIRALNELMLEGYLTRIQGKGTYVSKTKKHRVVKYSESNRVQFTDEDVKVVSIKKISDPRINIEMGLSEKDFCYHIVRVRYADGVPFIVHNSYILKDYIAEERVKNPDLFVSIYDQIKEDFSINLFDNAFREEIEINRNVPKQMTDLLNLEVDSYILLTRRYTFLYEDRVIEYTESFKNPDYFRISIIS